VLEPVTVPCQECDVEFAGDSPDLRLELTCDDEPLTCFSSSGPYAPAFSGQRSRLRLFRRPFRGFNVHAGLERQLSEMSFEHAACDHRGGVLVALL
jgi:hypothetical protein